MSYAKMSREEAQAIVDQLKAENVRSSDISKRMLDEGFSFAEIYEMLGEEQDTKAKPDSLFSQFGLSEDYSHLEYPKPKSFWQNLRFTDRVIRYGLAGIFGIIGFFAVLFSTDAEESWLLCAFPLLSIFGFVRLWLHMDN